MPSEQLSLITFLIFLPSTTESHEFCVTMHDLGKKKKKKKDCH